GIDWVMSLEPDWSCTVFGALVAAGHLVAALAFAIAVASWLPTTRLLAELGSPVKEEPDSWNDLGNLLLAFVMVWTYLAFSQFLIIWSGNLPEEIEWYQHRSAGGWEWIAWLLIVCNFALPFLALLMRDIKRRPERLGIIAGVV